MELKHESKKMADEWADLLIVPYGIETYTDQQKNQRFHPFNRTHRESFDMDERETNPSIKPMRFIEGLQNRCLKLNLLAVFSQLFRSDIGCDDNSIFVDQKVF